MIAKTQGKRSVMSGARVDENQARSCGSTPVSSRRAQRARQAFWFRPALKPIPGSGPWPAPGRRRDFVIPGRPEGSNPESVSGVPSAFACCVATCAPVLQKAAGRARCMR